ncbi:uncharacterized protein APUU_60746S [Aspergillus puulaauensis]|uniref:Aminotransferase class I/classII large domain-containing protein n=1 Tax=Aspergillus puulaauensis TaxID=1220207 RepID=A0A7R8ASA1_9EURO|nr:uncharacterized protein APUU_60746S [Aspergillus puulaauensis]BCS27698.1 hypothetical protein APUU_60746S [Aspergillus puulaauensis]
MHPETNPGRYVSLGVAENTLMHEEIIEHMTKNLLVASGVGQAIELSGFCLLDKDDGVLLARPHYGNFPIDLGYRVGAKIIGVSFGETDPFVPETVGIDEKALADAQRPGIRVKAFLLCNPQNPLGRSYTREVLEAYKASVGISQLLR